MFKDALKELRIKRNLTQEQLANKLDLAKSTISMYENGKREPDLETLELFADFFNVDMNKLTGTVSNSEVLSDVYFSLAKSAQDEGINPDDIKIAIETIKNMRAKKNGGD